MAPPRFGYTTTVMSGLPITPPEPRVRAVAAPAPRRALASPAVWLVALAALALFIALSAAPARAGTEPVGLSAAEPTGLTGGVDDWVHIWQVVQFATVQQTLPRQPGGPRVYYLGDSIARESTVGDESSGTVRAPGEADSPGRNSAVSACHAEAP